ncbi:uncharacterized protein LACBIDRAFT_323199 [Laccaria bicolor S238N-H82]|uniref:Predicted protein n=1 Tax=Laccaria bicolor (strain S238N-H82 / ATCC MYA-4686) TaxID=486041 RepID=B0CZF5_LACBS|nr:uncharacterized protein LACBIDRAFT_323199 [Laccaria bicolor S238N-H82]EDR12614.1 predicted protein [Laccaria bicolor S238N-H82]|eukprot:XP_001876878.1 predicted protein [Laccaria bicolor S238N-H82]
MEYTQFIFWRREADFRVPRHKVEGTRNPSGFSMSLILGDLRPSPQDLGDDSAPRIDYTLPDDKNMEIGQMFLSPSINIHGRKGLATGDIDYVNRLNRGPCYLYGCSTHIRRRSSHE